MVFWKKAASADKARPPAPTQPWKAVSVVAGIDGCAAAQALRGKRFLSNEAPLLPVRDCGSPGSCKCRYQHHHDRRAVVRRAADRGELPVRKVLEKDMRSRQSGRRADDQIPDPYAKAKPGAVSLSPPGRRIR